MDEWAQEEEPEGPKRTPVLPGVQASLAALNLTDLDAAAASLAVRYAELMDEAVAAQKYAKAIRVMSNFITWNIDNLPQQARRDVMDGWDRITAALAEHTVASDLGPKLLAALTGLQLTPAARAAAVPESASKAEVTPLPNALELLRTEAKERWSG